jgi:hypothetical protein
VNEDCASLYNKVTTTDHFWISFLRVEGSPKCFQFIHSRVIWDPWGFNVNFLLVRKLQLVWFSLLERKHRMDICTSLVWCMYMPLAYMFTCRQLHYAHILFNPFHKVSNAGMIFPVAMKNPPTTVMCFHWIPLGLLSQFKCLKIGSILTSPSSKLGEFGEILVNWIFTHTIHQIGCNFWWEKLNFHTISLTLGSMVYPHPPQEADKAMSANAGVEGSTISTCVTTGPWFRGTPPLNLSFLQKPKVANGFESGS